MAHWGWYWSVKKKYKAKKLCSNLRSIDSFKVQKPNMTMIFYVLENGINLATAVEHKDHFQVNIGKQAHTAYKIPIDKVPCHYGGFKSYFRCPLCDRRSRILYFGERSLFLCRKCLNLSYESQQLRPALRYDYMVKKLTNAIKNKGGDVTLHEKPPHMHHATYYHMRSKIIDYEGKSEQARMDEMIQWFGAERVSAFFNGF